MHRTVGLMLIVAGAAAILLGVLIASGALAWFGRLPGDIRIERDNVALYVPITSMLVVSLAVSLVVVLIRRLL